MSIQLDSKDIRLSQAKRYLDAAALPDAEEIYTEILDEAPDHLGAMIGLGQVMLAAGHPQQAINLLQRALEIEEQALVHRALGAAFALTGALEQALYHYGEAERLGLSDAALRLEIGKINHRLGRYEAAITIFQTLAETLPELAAEKPDAYNNWGVSLQALEQLEAAIVQYSAAINRRANYAEAHWNRSMALLRDGQWPAGFIDYEWRVHLGKNRRFRRDLGKPRWNNEPLEGKKLLLLAEQGAGDSVQFSRYIPPLIEAGAEIIFEVQPELIRLLGSLRRVPQMIALGAPLPKFDYYAPLLSLPLHFGTTIANAPADIPYLFADPQVTQKWAPRFADAKRPRVGIVWAGAATHIHDPLRSAPLEQWQGLLKCGVNLFALQVGPAIAQASEAPWSDALTVLSHDFGDFADTAAAIMHLDLVITVDTSVAHVAAALGKPVWTMIITNNDWRWLRERNDTVWYPNMKLYRQTIAGDWRPVFAQIETDLRAFSASFFEGE